MLEVYQNLIDNAIKFMGEQPEPRIEINGQDNGAEVVCFVRDDGIGIDPRFHESDVIVEVQRDLYVLPLSLIL